MLACAIPHRNNIFHIRADNCFNSFVSSTCSTSHPKNTRALGLTSSLILFVPCSELASVIAGIHNIFGFFFCCGLGKSVLQSAKQRCKWYFWSALRDKLSFSQLSGKSELARWLVYCTSFTNLGQFLWLVVIFGVSAFFLTSDDFILLDYLLSCPCAPASW